MRGRLLVIVVLFTVAGCGRLAPYRSVVRSADSVPVPVASHGAGRPADQSALRAALVWVAAVEAAAIPACGGDLPPCFVVERESHGDIYAVNPGHLGAPFGDPGDPATHASGKWQFMPGTWAGWRGFPYAAAAPAWVQNERARVVFAAEGMRPWACC